MAKRTGLLALGLAAALAGGGWLALSGDARPGSGSNVAPTTGAGVLDGMTFAAELGPVGKPADVADRLVFKDGLFVSKECQRRCAYPPAPYFTRRRGDTIEFVSESHCTENDATIVWRGTIEGERIEGVFTWTAKRWYWTIEREFRFAGTLAEKPTPLAQR